LDLAAAALDLVAGAVGRLPADDRPFFCRYEGVQFLTVPGFSPEACFCFFTASIIA
jgi:hypothetical protein